MLSFNYSSPDFNLGNPEILVYYSPEHIETKVGDTLKPNYSPTSVFSSISTIQNLRVVLFLWNSTENLS